MATKTIETRTSDLSGTEDAQEVSFGFDGTAYTVDLTEGEYQEFHEVLAKYIGVASKAGAGRGRPAATPARAGGAKRSDLDAVRSWARDNGHEVSGRGRVSNKILAAYDAAH